MQNAETVLNVIRECGEQGLPLENIYRPLYNRNFYLRACPSAASYGRYLAVGGSQLGLWLARQSYVQQPALRKPGRLGPGQ